MASRLKKPSLSLAGLSTLCFRRISRLLLVVSISGLALAGCGFEAMYRADNLRTDILSELAVPDSRLGRQLERALRGRLIPSPNAPWSATIELEETRENMQLDSQGVAQRSRLSHRLNLTLRSSRTGKTRVVVFQEEQFFDRGNSGADEMARVRALRALAINQLTDKLTSFLQTLAPHPEPAKTLADKS